MKNFFNIEPFGELYIDRIFFEANAPILFSCKNAENQLFLSVCCVSNSTMNKWLVSKICIDTLIELLSDKITIRDAFLNSSKYKYTIIQQRENVQILSNEDCPNDWSSDSIFLPTADEYIDAEDDEFVDDIAYFRSLRVIECMSFENVNNLFSKTISITLADIHKQIDDAIKNSFDYSNYLGEQIDICIQQLQQVQSSMEASINYVSTIPSLMELNTFASINDFSKNITINDEQEKDDFPEYKLRNTKLIA